MEVESEDKNNNPEVLAEVVNPAVVQNIVTENEVNQMTPMDILQCALGELTDRNKLVTGLF